jgi:hypothetical protein
MKSLIFLLICLLIGVAGHSQAKILSADIQIKLALLSAPADKKDSATVYGYSPDKQLIVLRKGYNELIALADDPDQPGFSVASYHKDLEPFMQRGRVLKKEGKTIQQTFETREKEVKSGKLPMPKTPATLYVYSASKEDYNDSTGEVKNGYLRYVIYVPYATEKSTGLPLAPLSPGMPWIMNPGTHAAHIMINPPKN